MSNVPLEKATQVQLYRYATVSLNLPGIQPNTGDAKLREKIRAATGEDTIYVQDSVKEDDPVGKSPRTSVNTLNLRSKQVVIKDVLRFAHKDPRFLVNIASGPGKGGKLPVPVSVNGTCILLPRGQDIEVPARYFFAMRNAVATIYEDVFDDKNMPVRQESDVPQYHYSVIRSPTQEEIDEWQEMIDAADRKAATKARSQRRARDEEREAA